MIYGGWASTAKNFLDLFISSLPLITFGVRWLKERYIDRKGEKLPANEKLEGTDGKVENAKLDDPDSTINGITGKLIEPLAADVVKRRISENFFLSELTHSHTAHRRGMANAPGDEEIDNLEELAENILEPIRERYPSLRVSSGYRSPAVNHRVGGRINSQHMKGEAADLHFPGVNLREVYDWIRMESGLNFDQLILEPRWIHVSYSPATREMAFQEKAKKSRRRPAHRTKH